MTRARLHGRYLANITGISGLTHTSKARLLIDTSRIVATRTTLTKVHFDFTSSSHVVGWTIAEIVASKG